MADWHPNRRTVRLVELSPFRSSVSNGSVQSVNGTLEPAFELSQIGREPLGMHRSVAFESEDELVATLSNDMFGDGTKPLGKWRYTRTDLAEGKDELGPSVFERWKPLEALLGKAWTISDSLANGTLRDFHVSFEWVPHADYVYARRTHVAEGTQTLASEAFASFPPLGRPAVSGLVELRRRGRRRAHDRLRSDPLGFGRALGDELLQRSTEWEFVAHNPLRMREWIGESDELVLENDQDFSRRIDRDSRSPISLNDQSQLAPIEKQDSGVEFELA